jgi:putative PIN family toxin of toxin-antitoxin system
MTTAKKVVFDCNVFFQALISASGPARRLLNEAARGTLTLFVSADVLDELADVAIRPHIVRKYGLAAEFVAEFITEVRSFATFVEEVPHVFDFPRDPKDAHYVDLAVAVDATLIVSRDQDLLSLNDLSTPEGRDFHQRFPRLEILTPTDFLETLA